eukprot:974108-Pleurochrysis_carterae.AAC.2
MRSTTFPQNNWRRDLILMLLAAATLKQILICADNSSYYILAVAFIALPSSLSREAAAPLRLTAAIHMNSYTDWRRAIF